MDSRIQSFARLLNIMDELREKCPWDRKQTLESLRHLTIEETYELCDAILENDLESIRGELGDLILHVVFYSKILSESGAGNIEDVLNGICDKLIVRHPHIYGDTKADDAETVKRNWESIKLKEGKTSVLQGVPVSLPAMVKAYRIQEKAAGVGFDWERREDVFDKVVEEIQELNDSIESNNQADIEKEFGDVLFSLINYARFIHVNPEDALEKTNKKFIHRFMYIESKAKIHNIDINQLSLNEMNEFWEEAKKSDP